MSRPEVRALFVDIGGVLATNGIDTLLRRDACGHFRLNAEEVESRHHLVFELYETGKISWRDYMAHVIFFEPRAFTPADFTQFVFSRSSPYEDTIEMVKRLKQRYALKIVAVSNEGRELCEFRIARLKLRSFIDLFVVSCFVRVRKPDPEIYRLALDISQVEPGRIVYLEDRELFVEAAASLGIPGIVHRSAAQTGAALTAMGLEDRVAA